MPELPEIAALVEHLRQHAVGQSVARVDIAALNVLKTVRPSVTELHERAVTDARRHGKYLDLDCEGLHLVVHLAKAGWLRWSDSLAPTPPKQGKGPLALRVHLGSEAGGQGFDLTEAGTQKRLSVWVVEEPDEIEPIARLGPDALEVGSEEFAEILVGRGERLKTLLTDQSALAGIGNAYSDEILHAAKLSPFATAGRLEPSTVDKLYESMREILAEAVQRLVRQEAARLKEEKRSGMRVHGRTGLPCPRCGDVIREVSYSQRSLQYCATCQTGGKPLADRRLSRLLK